ncbi:unnamed protein product [Amaranthus hypochondriacus]
MKDPHEEDFLNVDQLISEEALTELYYDEHEAMQDQDYEHYESDNESLQEEQETDMEQQGTGDNEANQNTVNWTEGGTPAASRKQLTLQKKGDCRCNACHNAKWHVT